jgi:hypothetical protein
MKVSKYISILSGSLLPDDVQNSYSAVFDNQAEQLSKILDDTIAAINKAKTDPSLSSQGSLDTRTRLATGALAAIDTVASRQKLLASDLAKAQAGLPLLPSWQKQAAEDTGVVASQRQAEIRAMFPPTVANNLAIRDTLMTSAAAGDLEVVLAIVNAPKPIRAGWRLSDDDIAAATSAYLLKTAPEKSATVQTIQTATELYNSNIMAAKRLVADAAGTGLAALQDQPLRKVG